MSKTCFKCGAPIEDNAGFCPACGAPIPPSGNPQPTQRQASPAARPQHFAEPPKSKAPVIALVSVIAVLVIAGGVLAAILLSNKDNNTQNTQPAAVEATAQPTAATVPATAEPTQAPTAAPTQATAPQESGWVNENGESYYYINGVKQTNTVVGDDDAGYFYVNGSGVKDDGYCDALTVNGERWNVIEGKASRVEDDWDDCLHSALKIVAACTDSSMSRDEKLRAAFEYIKRDDVFLEGVLHDPPYRELDWPVVCANDLFVDGMGDCFSYGAAFAFIGKAIGYEECYACNSGGHGWSEINGKAYDVEWDMHHQEYNHFGVSPEDDCDVAYFTTLTEGVDWMYVRL